MCGLFGVTHAVGEPFDVERARVALDVLTHRGPDQSGDVDEGGVYMGHRRLSIIDTSAAGAQPMVSEDARFAIAVNGEIYNHVALREQLSTHPFRSGSDSEVVLHGVREWGVRGLLDRLDGMYALVIHDRVDRKIHLARDRVGIKPLYYLADGHRLAWASELKALRSYVGETTLTVDHTAIFDALTYRYIPAPKSLYVNVHKLRPAELVTFDLNSSQLTTHCYWQPDLGSFDDRSDVERSAAIRDAVAGAVESHLMSDVPLGYFLSGGMDSAIVLSHAVRYDAEPVAFTIGYDVAERDEAAAAAETAGALGVRHVVERLDASSSVDIAGRLADWFDEPFADSSALSTAEVCRLARERATVALSGDGGDELFAGYRWYRRAMKLEPVRRRLEFATRRLDRTAFVDVFPTEWGRRLGRNLDRVTRGDVVGLHAHLMGDHLGRRKERWRAELGVDAAYDPLWAYREHDRSELPLPTRLQWLDFKTFLPEDVLTKVDRVSMAVSLEVRVPLLARSVVELAFSMPPEFHVTGDELKGGLKFAYRQHLPAGVLTRPKQGFSVPIESWKASALGEHDTLIEAVVARFLDR